MQSIATEGAMKPKQGVALTRELRRLSRAEQTCERRGESAMARLINARRAQLEIDNLPLLIAIRETLNREETIWLKG